MIFYSNHLSNIETLIQNHRTGEIDRRDFEDALELNQLDTEARRVRRLNRIDFIAQEEYESRFQPAKNLCDKLPVASK